MDDPVTSSHGCVIYAAVVGLSARVLTGLGSQINTVVGLRRSDLLGRSLQCAPRPSRQQSPCATYFGDLSLLRGFILTTGPGRTSSRSALNLWFRRRNPCGSECLLRYYSSFSSDGAPVQAIELESWDKQIDNPKRFKVLGEI